LPWPMVHFGISNNLYKGNPTPSLLLGSIAPDAIHVRGQISREEKGVTHLVRNGKLPSVKLIIEKFKENLPKQSESEWKDFVVGYFTHIYTDVRWTDTLYAEFEQVYVGDTIRSTYNQEVSQVEFELQRSIRNYDEIIKLLTRAKGYSVDPYITQSEVNAYRDLKMEWLQDPYNEPNIKPIYFKAQKVNQFIKETSKEIENLLKEYDIERRVNAER
jgi:hypothetical protein